MLAFSCSGQQTRIPLSFHPRDSNQNLRLHSQLQLQHHNQLKYADRRGSPIAVIEGADEKAKGVVQIKDLILGAKIAETASLEEWKDRPSQFEVPRAHLVKKVREILRDHG